MMTLYNTTPTTDDIIQKMSRYYNIEMSMAKAIIQNMNAVLLFTNKL